MTARPLSLGATEVRETVIARIRAHTAHVGVVGLGYVGLPFAVEKAKVGLRVIGIDQNPLRAATVNRGEKNYIPDVKEEAGSAGWERGAFSEGSSSPTHGRVQHDLWRSVPRWA